jgi:lipopolysaccharide export system permease protein
MIILRYLTREVLQTTVAVTTVLVVIIMSGRFVKYLSEAASGKFDPSVLLSIMYYRLPGFLELIIPLGFMVAILMAYGRLYAEHEMTVLSSCGMSQRRLLAYTFVPGIIVATVVGLCSLWLTPLGIQKAEQIFEQQKNRNELDIVKPGRFQVSRTGKIVSYIEALSEANELSGVFVASTGVAKGEPLITVKSESAERVKRVEYQQRYLQLNNGVRYQGRPGEVNYRVTHFEVLGQHLAEKEDATFTSKEVNSKPTLELWGESSAEKQAALQARVSAPLIIFIITVIGVAMSYTTPRRGRYVMLFPAIILYLVYLVLLNRARESIEAQTLAPAIGLWSVHLVFAGIAGLLFAWRTGVVGRLLRASTKTKKTHKTNS